MPFLKSITPRARTASGRSAARGVSNYLSGANGVAAKGIESYLERGRRGHEAETGERILLHAHSDSVLCDDTHGWADEFQQTKIAWNKESGTPYFHFIISPHPDDRVSPEETLEVATEWVEEVYPGSQWFCAIHDDNEGHIPHAHIVVNSVMPDTGRRIHRSRMDILLEDRTAQEIGRRHGLTEMPDLADRWAAVARHGERMERSRASSIGRAERAMRREGRWSWKAQIRDAVDAAAAASDSWDEFEARLSEEHGVEVVSRRRGITYVLEFHDTRRAVKGSTLGAAYTREGIIARLGMDFDAVLGLTRPTWGRRHPSPHQGAPRLSGARRARRQRPPRRPRPWGEPLTLAEAAAWRAARNPVLQEIGDLFTAFETVEREGIRTRGQLRSEFDQATQALAAIQSRVTEERRAAEAAESLLSKTAEIESIQSRLTELQGGFLRREGREERSRLTERLDALKGEVSERVGRASEFARREGIPADDAELVATRLLASIRERLGKDSAELARISTRLDSIRTAERVATDLFDAPRAHTAGRGDARSVAEPVPGTARRAPAGASGDASAQAAQRLPRTLVASTDARGRDVADDDERRLTDSASGRLHEHGERVRAQRQAARDNDVTEVAGESPSERMEE